MDTTPDTTLTPRSWRRMTRKTKWRQFGAVLHKNYLLQTRGRRLFGAISTGWAGMVAEICVPVLFFMLMWLPKYFFKPQVLPLRVYDLQQLDSTAWAATPAYGGPAADTGFATLLYTPNTTRGEALMRQYAAALACPPEPSTLYPTFYHYFRGARGLAACNTYASCVTTPACHQDVWVHQIFGFANESDALQYVRQHGNQVDALMVLHGLDTLPDYNTHSIPVDTLPDYKKSKVNNTPSVNNTPMVNNNMTSVNVTCTFRLNHTETTSNRQIMSLFDLAPDLLQAQIKQNWFLINLQNTFERTVIGAAAGTPPISTLLSFKFFPWPAYVIDVAAVVNSVVFFNLLLVYAFLTPTRGMVVNIVREKELRLREGMKILGLQDTAYWVSWAATHMSTLAVTAFLCALVGIYPFAHSSASLLLVFYLLVDAALMAWAYFLSTLFSKSRVAGTATAVLYSLAMVPGYLMPSVDPYGGWSWIWSCLLPPSCISLFGHVLTRMEGSGQGVTWSTAGTSATSFFSFSTLTVMGMLTADIVLYSVLTWYCDKVMPRDVGQRLPWYFILQPSYWRGDVHIGKMVRAHFTDGHGHGAGGGEEEEEGLQADPAAPAVHLLQLTKLFRTTDGTVKRAVDALSLDVHRGEITALLGHNGAGKTTTISMLTGMLTPTSGDAFIGGYSINVAMSKIRQNLGICPQFDILWPDITVREHLQLYAAIKGCDGGSARGVAEQAAASVGLTDKLDSLAGELSGGQRRKLSVGIAFMGNPAVVFLDEPTSGMDPYSRRFTWDVIRHHREDCAVVLTTHSMEEADVLADRIAIMAEGHLAAVGTSLELKAQYGVGYTLTVVKDTMRRQTRGALPPTTHNNNINNNNTGTTMTNNTSNGSQGQTPGQTQQQSSMSVMTPHSDTGRALQQLVQHHVPDAQLVGNTGAEVIFRLPKENAPQFGPLLRALQDHPARYGCSSYGLSVTTLEEVFLAVTAQAMEAQAKLEQPESTTTHSPTPTPTPPNLYRPTAAPWSAARAAAAPLAPIPPERRLHGVRLRLTQWWALFVKRALSARRDKLAVLTQLLVPLLLVGIALWSGDATQRVVEEGPLVITRHNALLDKPLPWAAPSTVRTDQLDDLLALFTAYQGRQQPGQQPAWHVVNGVNSSSQHDGDVGHDALSTAVDQHDVDQHNVDLVKSWTGAHMARALLSEEHLSFQYTHSRDVWRNVWRIPTTLGGPQWPPRPPPPPVTVLDSDAHALARGCIFCTENLTDTLDGWLLSRWHTNAPVYDALFVHDVHAVLEGPSPLITATIMVNETALFGLSAAVNAVNTALLRLVVGDVNATIGMVNHPLPLVKNEAAVTLSHIAGELLLIVFMTMGSCVLSAAFVVFLVRERACKSKEVQCVSGAPLSIYWAATLCWDVCNYLVPLAGFIGFFIWWNIPEFQGERLVAAGVLLLMVGIASLALTYLLQFMFLDEMAALQRLNTIYFLVGYLGFLATWLLDILYMFQHWSQVRALAIALKAGLQVFSPHYCLARGLYNIGACYKAAQEIPNTNPFAWDAAGHLYVCLAGQFTVYMAATLLVDTRAVPRAIANGVQKLSGTLTEVPALLRRKQRSRESQGRGGGLGEDGGGGGGEGDVEAPLLGGGVQQHEGVQGGVQQYEGVQQQQYGGGVEDPDVEAERLRVQHGEGNLAVTMYGIRKTFRQGLCAPPLVAVRNLWLGADQGECFGLLGVNGAGKTTAFRMVTGELYPDAGDVSVCGASIRHERTAARQLLGYCPQYDALPGALTGREVLTMYARLRGVQPNDVGATVNELLERLQLSQYANRVCDTYSGGTKRKLSVAVALVGQPPVVLMDEPSTGMDPAARRFMWSSIQSGVMAMGHTVLLTSHSMEECEALCGRIGILKAGNLQCVGSVQHLKNRFGAGYRLLVRCAPDRHAAVVEFVGGACRDVQVQVTDAEHVRFTMPREAVDLPTLFEGIEAQRAALGIEEYSLSQTTLEQVFVLLAQDGEEGQGGVGVRAQASTRVRRLHAVVA